MVFVLETEKMFCAEDERNVGAGEICVLIGWV